ncbi:MAG: hypothetical protein NTX57_09825 [Armatimonadetes bacterium]|nr:hypothetical protein [Armatimonadota bacterium]
MTDESSGAESEPVTVSVSAEELAMAPRKRLMREHLDGIQHGIDDSPENDAAKGSVLGAGGGAVVGGIAGAALGPLGSLVGALVGAATGALASGLAVAAVDSVDNDDNITGIGSEVSIDTDEVPTEEINTIIHEKQAPF